MNEMINRIASLESASAIVIDDGITNTELDIVKKRGF